MAGSPQALGLIETVSLVALIEAADTMAKTAPVRITSYEKTGCAFLMIAAWGDLADVRAAVDAGRDAAALIGGLVGAHVIPSPADALPGVLPVGRNVSRDDFVCYC